MDQRPGGAALGVILIAIGVVFLIGQAFAIDLGDLGWPFLVIIPGVAMLAYGLLGARTTAAGMAIPGMIVTTTGLLLLYQNATDHWESWAYAWALVAPTSVGVALTLLGVIDGKSSQVRSGAWTAGAGLVLFLVGASFFEGVLHISGRDFGPLGTIGFPLVLILVGVALLASRLGSFATRER